MMGQNALKREAIARMLRIHPGWSDRRIANAVKIEISTEDFSVAAPSPAQNLDPKSGQNDGKSA